MFTFNTTAGNIPSPDNFGSALNATPKFTPFLRNFISPLSMLSRQVITSPLPNGSP